MKAQLEIRLKEFKAEYTKGKKALADLEVKQATLRDNQIRLEGAIRVIEEELSKAGIAPSNENVDPSKSDVMATVTSPPFEKREYIRLIKAAIMQENPESKRVEICRLYEILDGKLTKEKIDLTVAWLLKIGEAMELKDGSVIKIV